MKTKEFQALLDELGGLTPVQCAAVSTALATGGSAVDVVAPLHRQTTGRA